MKKILITGAAGHLGTKILDYLIKEKKYEITALDLKNKKTAKELKKFQKEINILYGDVNDSVLMNALIKDHDIVIHLAGVLPPLCNLHKEFGYQIEYCALENIINSILLYNQKCMLIYPSTTTLYKKQINDVTSKSKVEYNKEDYFSEIKEKCEKLIQENLKNYIILRMPFVLTNNDFNKLLYLYKPHEIVELITSNQVASSITKVIDLHKQWNKKILILSGGKNLQINSSLLNCNLFSVYTYGGNCYKIDKKIQKMVEMDNESIDFYFEELKKKYQSRFINRWCAFFAKNKIKKHLKNMEK